MALARTIIRDALTEIGALAQGEAPSSAESETALRRLQYQIDSWNAEELTLAVQQTETFTLLSGTSSVTIGAAGADVTAARPTFITMVNYVNPGSSPPVEVTMGQMDRDGYANLSIKTLSSALPTQWFYSPTTPNGTLVFWPVVSQDVTIKLYYPLPNSEPATLQSDLIGPPGYQEAFLYQLALRLCTPFGRSIPEALPSMAAEALARMKRPNTSPGLLGVDAAVAPRGGGGYNVLSDGYSGQGR